LCATDWVVARELGFFADEGIDVEFLPQSPGARDFTTADHHDGPIQADLGVAEYAHLVKHASDEATHYVVAGEHSGCIQLVAPADSPVETIADLKGKRIGKRPNVDSLQWEFLAKQAGLSPGDLTWVDYPYPPSQLQQVAVDEFAAARLDAFLLPDPFGEVLKAQGVARHVASNTWTEPLSNMYCCMLVVKRELHDQVPGLSEAFVRAIRRGTAVIERDPAEAVRIAVEAGHLPADIDREVAARLLGEYVWTNTGRIEQDLERYFEMLIEAGRIESSEGPRDLVARVYRGVE
jgi:NitT/TauT family transport system substrate-binding protein